MKSRYKTMSINNVTKLKTILKYKWIRLKYKTNIIKYKK